MSLSIRGDFTSQLNSPSPKAGFGSVTIMQETEMQKAKTIAIIVVAILLIIVFLQNTQSVEPKILFMTLIMPRVLLLAIMLLVGFVIGLVVASHMGSKIREKSQPQRPQG